MSRRTPPRAHLQTRMTICGEWQDWYVTTDGEMDRSRAIELAKMRQAEVDKRRKEYRVVDLTGAVIWPESAHPYVTYQVIGDRVGGGVAWMPPTVNRRQALRFLQWEHDQKTTGLSITVTRYSPLHKPRYTRVCFGTDGRILCRSNEAA